MTPYLEYHPGGIPELMRGIGRDATDLFDEVTKTDAVLDDMCMGLHDPLGCGFETLTVFRTEKPQMTTLCKKTSSMLGCSLEQR